MLGSFSPVVWDVGQIKIELSLGQQVRWGIERLFKPSPNCLPAPLGIISERCRICRASSRSRKIAAG